MKYFILFTVSLMVSVLFVVFSSSFAFADEPKNSILFASHEDYVKYDLSKDGHFTSPIPVRKMPLPSDIRQSMWNWCSDSGSSSKIDLQFWDTVPIKILSSTVEFKSLQGIANSFVVHLYNAQESCPPIVEMTGTFKTKTDDIHEFALSYNGNFFGYNIDDMPSSASHMVVSPLKQFKSGIPIEQIQCKEGLQLVFKSTDEVSVCVTYPTGVKLIERGWGTCVGHWDYHRGTPCGAHSSTDGGTTNSSREITVLSISPENVTLPDYSKDRPKIPTETKIPINKSKQISVTNSNSATGLTTHFTQITINDLIIDAKGNPPARSGFDTWVFDYSIENTDNSTHYAILDFEVQFGQKTYASESIGDEFYWMLSPDEKRDAKYAIQVSKGINQAILNIRDHATKKILWSIPLDLTPYKIKYHTGYSNLIQE